MQSAIPAKDEHYPCPENEASCVACHMPLVVKTGGTYTLRSHSFKIIPPEATKKYNMPSSCQNGQCHQDKNLQWAQRAFDSFYKKSKKQTLLEQLKIESQ